MNPQMNRYQNPFSGQINVPVIPGKNGDERKRHYTTRYPDNPAYIVDNPFRSTGNLPCQQPTCGNG